MHCCNHCCNLSVSFDVIWYYCVGNPGQAVGHVPTTSNVDDDGSFQGMEHRVPKLSLPNQRYFQQGWRLASCHRLIWRSLHHPGPWQGDELGACYGPAIDCYFTIDCLDFRLSKRQSPTTFFLKTKLTRKITIHSTFFRQWLCLVKLSDFVTKL